jgi:hypothetical protein
LHQKSAINDIHSKIIRRQSEARVKKDEAAYSSRPTHVLF